MSYDSYQALLEERERLDERVKKLDAVISAAYNRLPLRQFTVTFVVRSVGVYDYVSETHTSDPLSAVVFSHTPDAAREYLLDEDISALALDAIIDAEAEIEDLLLDEIEEVQELAREEGEEEDGLVTALEFSHEISIISVVDDGLADDVENSDGDVELTELTTT